MKKAVIFTMDAVVALAIFIGSLVFFARFFTDTTFAGMSSSNIYSDSDKFIATTIEGQNLQSQIYYNYIDEVSNTELLNSIIGLSNYQINLKFYLKNGSTLQQIANLENYNFDQKLVLRRNLIYGEIINNSYPTNASFLLQSGLPGSLLQANVTLTNPGPNNWTDIGIKCSEEANSWTITPTEYSIPALNAQDSVISSFNITVPADATLGTYYLTCEIQYNDGVLKYEYPYQAFYVIGFGLVEMEVGLT